MTDKWNIRFLKLAKEVSTWSKDESTKVGAVIVDQSTQVGAVIVDQNKRIVSLGFNGFPQGIQDNPDKYQDRETKYSLIIHAEINAITFANKDLTNCILYTYPMLPCIRCAVQIIQNGIVEVVSVQPNIEQYKRWGESIKQTEDVFNEANIKIRLYDNLD